MRRYLQFYIFMNLHLHPEERKIVSLPPHRLHCLSLAFCSLFQDPMPPPGFPPSPASPPLILWTHCEPRATSSVTAGARTRTPAPSVLPHG